MTATAPGAALSLRDAGLAFGTRSLWSGLDLDVAPGELVAVLGANGTGKSSLLKVLLGLVRLSQGEAQVLGTPVRRGRRDVGYVPQTDGQRTDVAVRARDLVRYGVDGHRFGLGGGRAARARTDELLDLVGATAYADQPLRHLSGGERQRLRVAQAFAREPGVLLCDEPLQSLDQHRQRVVVELVDRYRREHGAGVLFVTHEINPVLAVADRVLYLGPEDHRLGTTDEVMTGPTLSALYGTEVDVLRHQGRLIVVGADDAGPVGRAHHADHRDAHEHTVTARISA